MGAAGEAESCPVALHRGVVPCDLLKHRVAGMWSRHGAAFTKRGQSQRDTCCVRLGSRACWGPSSSNSGRPGRVAASGRGAVPSTGRLAGHTPRFSNRLHVVSRPQCEPRCLSYMLVIQRHTCSKTRENLIKSTCHSFHGWRTKRWLVRVLENTL